MTLPPLTAILTCRNAAPTLPALLDHLERQGAQVVLVDHGSTDATWQIGSDRRGAPVTRMLREPFTGVFDLTRQLRLKREIIRSIGAGWVIHVDADEFLDPPAGMTLRDFVAKWDRSVCLAASTRELVFLPRRNSEVHAPESFVATLRSFVHLQERDSKQRLFRWDAPLDLWMATGGHTVTVRADEVIPDRLDLRHYLGLSLDHIRAQYYARVFARSDIAKYWHGNRHAATLFDIVEPPPSLLAHADAKGPIAVPALRRPPVFAPSDPLANRDDGSSPRRADLVVFGPENETVRQIPEMIAAAFPGLKMRRLPYAAASLHNLGPVALLHVLEHPGRADAKTEPVQREAACDWVRRLAVARQVAQRPGMRYAETRIEDLEAGNAALKYIVRQLILGGLGCGTGGFLTAEARPLKSEPYSEIAKSITGELARDVGYH